MDERELEDAMRRLADMLVVIPTSPIRVIRQSALKPEYRNSFPVIGYAAWPALEDVA